MSSFGGYAQFASISGLVMDSTQSQPLPFAEVVLQPGYRILYTDQFGHFQFDSIPAGEITLSVSNMGCGTTENKIQILPNEKREINLMMPCKTNMPDIATAVLAEVMIETTRATPITPMTYVDISKQAIEFLNTSQDIPQLLRYTPSLVSTSDAGNGVGYTGLWIRGSDPSRINVSINGIPLNDPESQQVFWVNTPDLASSASNIQIQRGIGTSANGAASFGGNIKIETRDVRIKPYAELSNSFGSFNTLRNTVSFGTGMQNNHFVLEGRLSRIKSDGYIDRAKSDLKSFFLEGNYIGNKTTIKLNIFGGRENTYQSWYGTPVSILQNNTDSILAFAERNYLNDAQLSNMLNSGRTYNYYEYANQVDNYGQDHFQLHITREITSSIMFNLSAHYTHGRGYFEEFKNEQDYSSYGLLPVIAIGDTIVTTDLIRQRWLSNDFYGIVSSITFKKGAFESALGGAFNEYIGNHFGKINWMAFAGPYFNDQEYYRGRSVKHDANIYWRNSYVLKNKLAFYADAQIRSVIYNTSGNDNDLRNYDIKDELLFFNPKLGAKYFFDKYNHFYASVAMASKEPNRNDYVDAVDYSVVKPEQMTDIETGYQFTHPRLNFSANGYYMNYKNQLVLTGALNDVGAPIRMNVNESFRRGIELAANTIIKNKFNAQANLTWSQNKINEFNETIYDYTIGYDSIFIQHKNTDIAFSPQWIAAAAAGYTLQYGKKNHKLQFDLLGKYVGKQYLDNTQNEILSIDAYFIPDLKISTAISMRNYVHIDLALFIHNFTNQQYVTNGYTYSYIYEQRITERFYYPQAGRNYSLNLILKF